MDQEELDAWLSEQKEALLKDYLKSIEEKRDRAEAEKEYKEKLIELIRKYNDEVERSLRKKQKSFILKIWEIFEGRIRAIRK